MEESEVTKAPPGATPPSFLASETTGGETESSFLLANRWYIHIAWHEKKNVHLSIALQSKSVGGINEWMTRGMQMKCI